MESVVTAEETGNDGSTSECLQPDDEDSGVYVKKKNVEASFGNKNAAAGVG